MVLRHKETSDIQKLYHYSDVIISTMAFQITCVSIVCPTVGSDVDQRKHYSSASLAFVRGFDRWLVYSPHHKRPVKRKMLPFTLTLSQCTLAGPVDIGMPLECHWLTQCSLGYNWATERVLAGHCARVWSLPQLVNFVLISHICQLLNQWFFSEHFQSFGDHTCVYTECDGF